MRVKLVHFIPDVFVKFVQIIFRKHPRRETEPVAKFSEDGELAKFMSVSRLVVTVRYNSGMGAIKEQQVFSCTCGIAKAFKALEDATKTVDNTVVDVPGCWGRQTVNPPSLSPLDSFVISPYYSVFNPYFPMNL